MAFSKLSEDVFATYRAAYSLQIDWSEVFDEDIFNWLSIFEKGKNCSLNLTIPALLAMAASLCGPDTKIIGHGNGFSTSTNVYMLAVCDPGGGKSVTYENVIEPVMSYIYEKTGLKIGTESYTSAGLQRHQIASKGVGLITSDEGHRFLASVNAKQAKGESERAYLCKMWSGKDDFVELSTGTRGFQKTSMSMCIYIQPHPLMSEMCNFSGADGFLDRILIAVSRPLLFPTYVVKENYEMLRESGVENFAEVFYNVYANHKEGLEYSLSEDAQKEYDSMVDSYAEQLDEKYKMDLDQEDDDENKENEDFIPATQTNLCMSTSKDTIHILRLAAAIHVITQYLRASLTKVQIEKNADPVISLACLKRARVLYSYLARQKSVFAQAVRSMHHNECFKLKKVASFKSRVIKAVALSKGPVVTIRVLQRKLNGSLRDSILHELGELEHQNLGLVHRVGKSRKEVFMKSAPSKVSADLLRRANVPSETYAANFKKTIDSEKHMLLMALPSHPHHDEIIDWFL